MKSYSELFGYWYEAEDVLYIPNMLQNYKYLDNIKSKGLLVDIICGSNNKIVFVWKKSKEINELYDKWCKREL